MNYKSTFVLYFLLLNFASTFVFGQELFLTAKYNNEGVAQASLTSKVWKIDAIEGSFLYVLYRQKEEIKAPKLYLFLDKKVVTQDENEESKEEFLEYDTKKIFIHKKRNWAVIKYTFRQAGTYKISIADADKNVLISEQVQIQYKSKLLFSNQLDENKMPLKHKREFDLVEVKKGVHIFIKDETPFGSTSLKVVIEKRVTEKEYQITMEETFFIDEKIRFSFFEQVLEERGTYRVSVFKENEELLEVGFLKIL